ncbi:hypothetical protein MMC07_002298 [Pseudocyphellaria aurata]|nr:hypothetical protein [Pseudocyphellaria aurata]
MEAPAIPKHSSTVPAYEEWPSVPNGPLKNEPPPVSPMTVDEHGAMMGMKRDTSALSMDDIEAAQALEGLRADCLNSPQTRLPAVLPAKAEPGTSASRSSSPRRPEPLLSLLTSQHPLLSTAIYGSLSAYTTSKSYSPRFKYGAELVEKHIGSSVVNTVGTAGRISGVETGVRWFLRRSNSNEADRNKKRRRSEEPGAPTRDIERGLRESSAQSHIQHRFSEMSFTEPLPPYDEERSPMYEEHKGSEPRQGEDSQRNRNWQTRLILSTSALGVAMSEESLRSLKYCLGGVRWANGRLCGIIVALQRVVEEWNGSRQESSHAAYSEGDRFASSPDARGRDSNSSATSSPPRDRTAILQHIQALKSDAIRTVKQVVEIVSKYAGGALPENARNLIHKYLTTIPHRFRLASLSNGSERSPSEHEPESETITNAKRAIRLVREGLDLLAQISGVLDGTIMSAEEWCDRLGRKRARSVDEEQSPATKKQMDHKAPADDTYRDVRMTSPDQTWPVDSKPML